MTWSFYVEGYLAFIWVPDSVSAMVFFFRNLILDGNVADEENWYELIAEESP